MEVRNGFDRKRASIRKLTNSIDRVVEELTDLENPSPREVNREMTVNFRKIGTISEKIKRNDLNPSAFHANRAYKMSKNTIKAYIEQTYNKADLKDDNRVTEILQNRPLTSFYQPSTKLLFNSLEQDQIQEIFTQNKRKFGEFWNITPKTTRIKQLPELSPIITTKKSQNSPRNHLSVLIKDLFVKKLGIKTIEKKEKISEKYKSNFFNKNSTGNQKISFTEVPEEIEIRDEKDYLGPEYANYIADVPNKLKIERYIGINSGRQRKMNKQLARLSMI